MQGLKKLYKRQLEIYAIREDRVKKIKSIREHVKENEEKIRSVDKRITINMDQVRVWDIKYGSFKSNQHGRSKTAHFHI